MKEYVGIYNIYIKTEKAQEQDLGADDTLQTGAWSSTTRAIRYVRGIGPVPNTQTGWRLVTVYHLNHMITNN